MVSLLDAEMAKAIADARASGWSEEGQIVWIRRHMNGVYARIQAEEAAREKAAIEVVSLRSI